MCDFMEANTASDEAMETAIPLGQTAAREINKAEDFTTENVVERASYAKNNAATSEESVAASVEMSS